VNTREQFLARLGPAGQVDGMAEVSINRDGQLRSLRLDPLHLRTGLQLADRVNVPVKAEEQAAGEQAGVPIENVRPDSLAADAGLRTGDQILALNGRPVSSTTNLRSGLTAAIRESAHVTLKLWRDGNSEDARLDFRMR